MLDAWGNFTRLVGACLLEKPDLADRVDLEDLAPGPSRDLASLIRDLHAQGRAADTAGLLASGVDLARIGGTDFILDLAEDPHHLASSFSRYLVECRRHAIETQIGEELGAARGPDFAHIRLLAERGLNSAEAGASDPFIDWGEFWTRDRGEPEWVVDPILARGRGHSIYAPHKAGKSLFSLWVALQAVDAGHVVVYLDWEQSEDDLLERLEAMGCTAETDLSLLRYDLIPNLPPLDTVSGGKALAARVDAEMTADPDRHVVVVIDTISRATVGEENSNDTIQAFYRHTGLELKRRRITWLRLDHEGKDPGKGPRGGSAKGDDVDVQWRLHQTEGGLELRRTLARMAWIPERVRLNKEETPHLTYTPTQESWPAGTVETAEILGQLGVPLEAPTRFAAAALKDAGMPRRRAVIVAAVKWRKQVGNPSGNRRTPESGNHSGCHPADMNPHAEGTDPGTTRNPASGQKEAVGSLYRGTTPGARPGGAR